MAPLTSTGAGDPGGTAAQVVVGGTLAALAAADALAASGRLVRLLLPRTGVGGGFMPVERDGRTLERGMRVLELRYEGVGAPPPLAEYEPGEHGHRPFVGILDTWVRELVGDDNVVEVDPPATFLGGRLGPEVLLSSDLSRAAELVGADDARRIAAEAAAAAVAHGEAGWLAPAEVAQLWQASLDDASVHHHGRTFHQRFLASFTDKIRPAGGRDVVAALRRKLWVPLYWPKTVAEAFGGQPVSFAPDRPFTVVRPGGMAPVVRALLQRLTDRGVDVVRYDSVARIEPAGQHVRISLSDGRTEVADRPILGLSAGDLFAGAGIAYAPDKVRSVLAWVEVREADILTLPGFVHVVDPDVRAYRITPGALDARAGARVLCVELAHDVAKDAAAATARGVLQQVGVLVDGATTRDLGVFAGPTFTDPTADSVVRHGAALAELRRLDMQAAVIGGVEVFGADSFNEHVIQGLHAAEFAA